MKKIVASAYALSLLGSAHAFAQVPMGNISLYTQVLTPAATPASIGTTEQTFTVNGLQIGDRVFINTNTAPTSLCPPVGARVTAANTLAIQFATLTAAACTPATAAYSITQIR